MSIQINRPRILFFGFAIIIIYFFLNRYEVIQESELTTGMVLGLNVEGYYATPVVGYLIESKMYEFEGVANMALEPGEFVTVIYSPLAPESAQVYSFIGFWWLPILYCIVPVLILISLVYTLFDSETRYNVSFKKGIEIVKTVKPKEFPPKKVNKIAEGSK